MGDLTCDQKKSIIFGIIKTNAEDTITESRKSLLSRIAEDIKNSRGITTSSSSFELEEVFRSFHIKAITDDRVIEPLTISWISLNCDSPPIVFLPTYGSSSFRRWYSAHELGHALLHADPLSGIGKGRAEKEQEANYFARRLIGQIPLRTIRNEEISRRMALQSPSLSSLKNSYDANPTSYLRAILRGANEFP